MTPRFDVLSYGTIGMDVILKVPHWPSSDLSTHSDSAVETMGGKATNTATHLAAWGKQVTVSGTTIGDDEIGGRVISTLARIAGLDTSWLGRSAGMPSMYCIILVRPDGERAIIGVHTDQIIATPPTTEMIVSARVLTLDLYGGDERVEAARLASEQQIPVIVGDIRRFDHRVLPYTTIAIASLAELQQEYPGISTEDCGSHLISAGASAAILTNGSRAITVVDGESNSVTFTPPRVKVVDTTGAGDAFRAGVVFGVLEGMSVTRSAMLGAAAGSLAVVRLGAAADPAPLRDVLSLADSLRTLPD